MPKATQSIGLDQSRSCLIEDDAFKQAGCCHFWGLAVKLEVVLLRPGQHGIFECLTVAHRTLISGDAHYAPAKAQQVGTFVSCAMQMEVDFIDYLGADPLLDHGGGREVGFAIEKAAPDDFFVQ